jgi:hypothetical protein
VSTRSRSGVSWTITPGGTPRRWTIDLGFTRHLGSDQRVETDYNYNRFDEYVASGAEEREFSAFPATLHAGDVAPDISGTLLNGGTVSLSQMWSRQPVVVEFGSFT